MGSRRQRKEDVFVVEAVTICCDAYQLTLNLKRLKFRFVFTWRYLHGGIYVQLSYSATIILFALSKVSRVALLSKWLKAVSFTEPRPFLFCSSSPNYTVVLGKSL